MKNLFSQWHFMRFLRLIFACYLAYEAYRTQQWFFVVFALFFLFQAVFNAGCCNTSSCAVPKRKEKSLN
jgi:hypothetical protein